MALLLTNHHFFRAHVLISVDGPGDGDYKSISTQALVLPPLVQTLYFCSPQKKKCRCDMKGNWFGQRVCVFTVTESQTVHQSAAEPKHTQQTEHGWKLTDRPECLTRFGGGGCQWMCSKAPGFTMSPERNSVITSDQHSAILTPWALLSATLEYHFVLSPARM